MYGISQLFADMDYLRYTQYTTVTTKSKIRNQYLSPTQIPRIEDITLFLTCLYVWSLSSYVTFSDIRI